MKPGRRFIRKLPKSPNRYTIKFVSDNYEKRWLSENFELVSIAEVYMFNILKNVEVTKAAGVDKISEKFLKDMGANYGKTY